MNFPVVKAVLREMEPLAFNALRFPCAAFAVWFLLKAQGRRLMPYRKDWLTVVARDTRGLPGRDTTVRVKAGDVAALHAGSLSLAEARARVDTSSF